MTAILLILILAVVYTIGYIFDIYQHKKHVAITFFLVFFCPSASIVVNLSSNENAIKKHLLNINIMMVGLLIILVVFAYLMNLIENETKIDKNKKHDEQT